MMDRFTPRVCLAVLAGGVVLSWVVAFGALAVMHVVGRWAAALLGWL